MGVAALVLGIIALVFCFTGWLAFVGSIIGVVGIVLGAIARKNSKAENKPTGVATAGLVMSIIAAALGVILWLACVACTKAATDTLTKNPEFQKGIQDLQKEMEKASKEMEKASKTK